MRLFYVDDVSLYVSRPGSVIPTLAISPAGGPNGTSFTVSGANFTANANVTLAVDGNVIKTVTAGSSGSFATTYTPSSLSARQHTLVASDGAGQAQTTFNITSQTSEPFRVTLAWTDFPGQPAAAKAWSMTLTWR